jgi:signal transduction histidine kinase
MAKTLTDATEDTDSFPRDRWESLLKLIPGVVFEQRTDLSFVSVGPGPERFFGSRSSEVAARSDVFLSCVHEDDRVGLLSWLRKLTPAMGMVETTYRLVHPDTGMIQYVADRRMRTEADVELYQGVWLDQTSQIRAEKRLTYRAWKETVSTVTSGLLHDFNNVVAGIFSLSELYHSLITPDHEMHAGIGQIKASSMEAQKLVRRIMELNREVSGERNLFNLESLLTDQLDFLRAILPRGTEIEAVFSGEELPVRLDDVGFRQVLLNLATNARDALGDGGRITIEIHRHDTGGDGPAGILPSEFKYPDGSVEVIFRDHGCGMTPGVAERVFDPFFSTKEPTKGSGLGLYNAQLFAATNRGRIGVITAPGAGTSFHLVLPLETFGEPAHPKAEDALTTEQRHHVLLYSWEDTSHSDLVAKMREQTWQVLTLTNADRVREYLAQSDFPIKMVVLLRIALDEDADRLLEQVRTEHPEITIAVITMGDDPEQTPKPVNERADLVLHHNMKLSTMIKRLTDLI